MNNATGFHRERLAHHDDDDDDDDDLLLYTLWTYRWHAKMYPFLFIGSSEANVTSILGILFAWKGCWEGLWETGNSFSSELQVLN